MRLMAWLVVDLVLSAVIFLFLPLVLWEAPDFLEAAVFEGDRPWLGIFFWTTFSTSVMFYLFFTVGLILILESWFIKIIRPVARFLDVETHPFSCIGVALVMLVIVAEVLRAIVKAVTGLL